MQHRINSQIELVEADKTHSIKAHGLEVVMQTQEISMQCEERIMIARKALEQQYDFLKTVIAQIENVRS